MSQYPGGQPPSDPYYGQPPQDPYAQPQQGDPYFGQPPVDQYGRPYPPPADPYYYGQQPVDPYAQQAQHQAYSGQAPYSGWLPPAAPESRQRSSSGGAAIVGVFLVVLGVWFMFRDEVALDFGRLWPAAAVALGVLMVLAALIPRRGR